MRCARCKARLARAVVPHLLTALVAVAQLPTHAQVGFPYVSPPPQPRYKPKPEAQQPGVGGESQRWYEQALREYNGKRFDSALALVDRSLQAGPNNVSAWYLRGVVQHSRKDHDAALAAYSRAIQLNPRFRKAYGDRALLHEQMGRQDLAAVDWSRYRSLGN
jgi:cytochrome c-type biogenesis protein CcmH/NrfG